MNPLPILDDIPLETLRTLATNDPARWGDLYDDECRRRHPPYQKWLRKMRRSHSAWSYQLWQETRPPASRWRNAWWWLRCQYLARRYP